MQKTPGNELGAVEPPWGWGQGHRPPCEEQRPGRDAKAEGFGPSRYYY